jgi:hypothetical protein
LKKSGTKSIAAGKKATGTKAGAAAATGSNPSRTSSLSKSATAAKSMSANGSKTKTGRGAALNGTVPMATKEDPLADVSFLDLDGVMVGGKNGSSAASGAGDDALSRVRRRRVTSGYARQNTA